MAWLFELLAQGIWESAAEFAHRRWGWRGLTATIAGPIALFVLVVWLIVR